MRNAVIAGIETEKDGLQTMMEKEFASFRDPSGFLFYQDGVLYRQVNQEYQPHYDKLMESGLISGPD